MLDDGSISINPIQLGGNAALVATLSTKIVNERLFVSITILKLQPHANWRAHSIYLGTRNLASDIVLSKHSQVARTTETAEGALKVSAQPTS